MLSCLILIILFKMNLCSNLQILLYNFYCYCVKKNNKNATKLTLYVYICMYFKKEENKLHIRRLPKKNRNKKNKIKQNNKISNSSKSQNTIQLKITPQIKFLLVGIFMKIILPNIQICLF